LETVASNGEVKGVKLDFFEYWDSLGFFDSIGSFVPDNFLVLFDIARIIFSEETSADALNAIEEISREERIFEPDRDENIQINRLDRVAPLSDKMEIDTYRNINELKKALPRELAMDDSVFDVRLFTKTLMVQKFYETESDSFKPVSTSRDEKGRDANRFDQKIYILLDRSKSMDIRMRSFYSKCIIAEFLRRKMKSNAKLYYRPFDTVSGKLAKLERREDFPLLIERILLTTTGGKSTELQGAIFQAISDIHYDKEMAKSEILVVTDGISKINKNELRVKLGDIRLNILKIGGDDPEIDYYDLEAYLKSENINIDPRSVDLREIKNSRYTGADENLSLTRKRVNRHVIDYSDKLFKDLKEVSHRYIEIGDLVTDGLYRMSDENLQFIVSSVDNLGTINLDEIPFEDKSRIYKQAHFLEQYINMLVNNGNADNEKLQSSLRKIYNIKHRMLKDPDILMIFMQVEGFDADKKAMKLARKEARRLMKEM